MLIKKLGAQFSFLRVVTVQTDDVHGDIAALSHQLINLLTISTDHFFLRRTRLDRRSGSPTIKAHTLLGQGGLNVIKVGQHLVWEFGAGNVINGQAAHGCGSSA